MVKSSVMVVVAVIVLVLGGVGGYYYGTEAGYKKAEQDIAKLQQEAGKKAAAEAAKSANPFQAENPLAGVETNALKITQDTLNPWKTK